MSRILDFSLLCLLTTFRVLAIHPDDLTSTSIQTDTNGNEIQNYGYSAFGQSRYTQSSTVFKVSRRYTGQVLDDGTGLYYYNARYYDPILGRFVQPDDVIPDLSDPQSYNRYAYCVNNPLRYTDPSGHGVADTVGDAFFNTGTFKTSYQLMTMRDSLGWKLVEVPTVVLGMAAATADSTLNFTTEGIEGIAEGGVKEGIKVGVKEIGSKEAGKVAQESATAIKNAGRIGKQERLSQLSDNPNISSADRGWIKNEKRQIETGNRDTIRNPSVKDLAHERGREAAKGYNYGHSNLQDRDLHKLQHKYDDFGKANKERPLPPKVSQ